MVMFLQSGLSKMRPPLLKGFAIAPIPFFTESIIFSVNS